MTANLKRHKFNYLQALFIKGLCKINEKEKIFAIHTNNKGLVSDHTKNSYESIKKKPNRKIKQEKEMNKNFTKEET